MPKDNLMEHYFDLPVHYKDQELILKARLVTFAYAYKFYIMVDGVELTIERDDEQEYRVMLPAVVKDATIDRELVEKIIEALERIQS